MPFASRVPALLLAIIVTSAAHHATDVAAIRPNDNRVTAGTMHDGALQVSLRIGLGSWYPDSDGGPHVVVQAFGEGGSALRIPGPLIRVRAGSTVDVTITNSLSDSAVEMHGLEDRPGADRVIVVAPGATQHVRFTLSAPGTYYYWGTTTHSTVRTRNDIDSQLGGAIVVDAPNARTDDRIFVFSVWQRLAPDRSGPGASLQEIMTINGKGFPYDEAITAYTGDTLRWRIVNPTAHPHPMHLHGFYYTIGSVGNGTSDSIYTPAQQRLVNTELMIQGTTMLMTWNPTRAGNWLFHCHLADHVSRDASLTQYLADSADPHRAMTHMHAMAGLVIPIHVIQRGTPSPVVASGPVRDIRLYVDSTARYFGALPAYGFAMQSDSLPPAQDSVVVPGPMLLLERSQPVRVHIVNRLGTSTAVHWHGIELESFPDGVPHFSGAMNHQFTEIAARDSFIAEFTPPRSGTFIYHTHFDELDQMPSGMYGALVVTDNGSLDAMDRVFIVGPRGNGRMLPPALMNGAVVPPPMHLLAGQGYRLRIISIHPGALFVFSLVTDSTVERWTPVAKDGADLPVVQRETRTARFTAGPGETADFLFTPTHPGTYRLEARTVRPAVYLAQVLEVR